jgi:hypothetical protein
MCGGAFQAFFWNSASGTLRRGGLLRSRLLVGQPLSINGLRAVRARMFRQFSRLGMVCILTRRAHPYLTAMLLVPGSETDDQLQDVGSDRRNHFTIVIFWVRHMQSIAGPSATLTLKAPAGAKTKPNQTDRINGAILSKRT